MARKKSQNEDYHSRYLIGGRSLEALKPDQVIAVAANLERYANTGQYRGKTKDVIDGFIVADIDSERARGYASRLLEYGLLLDVTSDINSYSLYLWLRNQNPVDPELGQKMHLLQRKIEKGIAEKVNGSKPVVPKYDGESPLFSVNGGRIRARARAEFGSSTRRKGNNIGGKSV